MVVFIEEHRVEEIEMTNSCPTFEQPAAWASGSTLGEVEATSQPTERELWLAAIESEECGYIVTPGFNYCRACGGSGLRPETRDECITCFALGEIKFRS